MIIRVFLFLLAMLTGVSAAQAAGNLHRSPSVIGSTAVSSARLAAPAVTLTRTCSLSVKRLTTADQTLAAAKVQIVPAQQLAVIAPTTFRSDRTRQ